MNRILSTGTLLWKIEQKSNRAFACGKVTIKGKRHWYEALPQAVFVALSDDTAWVIRTNGDLYLQTGSRSRAQHPSLQLLVSLTLEPGSEAKSPTVKTLKRGDLPWECISSCGNVLAVVVELHKSTLAVQMEDQNG